MLFFSRCPHAVMEFSVLFHRFLLPFLFRYSGIIESFLSRVQVAQPYLFRQSLVAILVDRILVPCLESSWLVFALPASFIKEPASSQTQAELP